MDAQEATVSVIALLKQIDERFSRSKTPLLEPDQWSSLVSICYLFHLRKQRNWLADLYQESPASTDDWTSDAVIVTAANQVWNEFVRKQKWIKALEAAASPEPGLTPEQAARGYLRVIAAHDVNHLLTERSVDYTLYQKVQRALSGTEFKREGEGATAVWGLSEHPEWLADPALNTIDLARELGMIRARGRPHQDFPGIDFPTPLQIAKLVRRICIEKKIRLTRDQILDLLHRVFEVPHDSDLNQSPPDGGEIVGPVVVPSSPVHEPDAVGKEITEKLVLEIERLDGCPIDPPDPRPELGRLGKVLVGFVLWRGMPLKTGKTFGLEAFESWSGYSSSTVEDWLKKDIAAAFQRSADGSLSDDELLALMEHLQRKFAHRRPGILL